MRKALTAIVFAVSLISVAQAQQPAAPQTSSEVEGRANITVGETTIPVSDLHARKLKRMRKLGVTILYPTLVPGRFSLASATLTDNQDRRSFAYHLRFCDKQHLCFSIESGDVDAGVGDISTGDKRLKGQSTNLGAFIIERYGNGGIRSQYLVWVAPRVRSWKGNLVSFSGTGVTDKEALAIVESLAPIE